MYSYCILANINTFHFVSTSYFFLNNVLYERRRSGDIELSQHQLVRVIHAIIMCSMGFQPLRHGHVSASDVVVHGDQTLRQQRTIDRLCIAISSVSGLPSPSTDALTIILHCRDWTGIQLKGPTSALPPEAIG
jgi:hypothetical protein